MFSQKYYHDSYWENIDAKDEKMLYYSCSQNNNKEIKWEMKYDYIPKLVRAALSNDKKNVEAISLMLGRSLKKDFPEVSAEIMKILSYSNGGVDVIRSLDIASLPRDKETRSRLVQIEEPIQRLNPILDDKTLSEIEDFIKERTMIEKFLSENVSPPNSILLHGKPGVGKTYIAKWLSYKLQMPMVTLDLANSISSYLGRSGQNIKSIFEYAKEQDVILFLDEIDAIAKRRDDASDLGELKRLVNVLLKELEDCPVTCVIIGATNHPELLDKAIWRRFDRNLEIMLPAEKQRVELLRRGFSDSFEEIQKDIIEMLVDDMDGTSAADICKFCEHVKRKKIINENYSITECILREYGTFVELTTKEQKKAFCKKIKEYNKKITIKEISEITGISQSSVDRYLKG